MTMDEIGIQILNSEIYNLILKTFEEDARVRFPTEYKDFTERSFEAFNNPTTAHATYNEELRKFLELRGYGGRYSLLFEKIFAAIKEENNETNLALHHLGKAEAKRRLSKENYAKLVKTN